MKPKVYIETTIISYLAGGLAMLGVSNQMRRATASESTEKQCRVGNDVAKNTASPRTPKQWHVRHNRITKRSDTGNHACRILCDIDACRRQSGGKS